MIESLKRAMSAYTKNPFPFAWASLIYVFLFFIFLFAVIGIYLAFFILMSVLGQEVNPVSRPSLAVAAFASFIFLFVLCGLNAALVIAYRNGGLKEKTSLTSFFSSAIEKAPGGFAIALVRDLIWLIFAAPAIAIFVISFSNMDYMDIALALYLLTETFFIHMLFTPAIIYSALGTDFVGAFRRTFNILRRKHVNFIGLYIVFCLAFVLNLIPLIGLFFIFCVYPISYTALIAMMEGIIRREEDEE